MSENSWSIETAKAFYHLPRWSEGYFDINDSGDLCVSLGNEGERKLVSLRSLAGQLQKQGAEMPVLLRFLDILGMRVEQLVSAFDTARRTCYYSGAYTAVYPIKVNQKQVVVNEIVQAMPGRVGLEAGSKAELLAVLRMIPEGGTVVCNGFKDRDFVRLALLGRALGNRVYVVIEKPHELDYVFSVCETLDVVPLIGVRVRLASVARGKWQNTGGDKGKFGLTAAQVMAMIERLKASGKLHWLQLLHFHIGSQVADLADLQGSMTEVGHYFAELSALGVPIRVVDVGGGLGVDYEGRSTDDYCSMNYTVAQYADTVIRTIHQTCVTRGLAAVEIFTEAGRAMTAHHSALVTEVLDYGEHWGAVEEGGSYSDLIAKIGEVATDELHQQARDRLNEQQQKFSVGELDIASRAAAESDFRKLCERLDASNAGQDNAERYQHVERWFLNFSLFQSIPDVWAFDQVFPILPLQRLQEQPDTEVVLVDTTCDSDGQIDCYPHGGKINTGLQVHAPRENESYLVGLFLVGAYQEILGDIHNLFGRTHAANLKTGSDGKLEIINIEHGDSAADLLRMVGYDAAGFKRQFRRRLESQGLEEAVMDIYEKAFEATLNGYSYHETIRGVVDEVII